jgi:hypothetical protein
MAITEGYILGPSQHSTKDNHHKPTMRAKGDRKCKMVAIVPLMSYVHTLHQDTNAEKTIAGNFHASAPARPAPRTMPARATAKRARRWSHPNSLLLKSAVF